MKAVLDIVMIVLDLFIWVIIIQAVMSWLISFNVLNQRNSFVSTIWRTLLAVTEPIVGPVRRIMPRFGALDLSPMVVVLGVILVQRVIAYYVYPNVF
ncbi:YggT family protein [bacterium]|nr:YggT family protein [bacterium]